jgi:3-hydroxyisobutyrate dehydrogenase
MANIAFIGLGNMGGPMAVNLVKSGHDVCVFDLLNSAVAEVEKFGARSASNASQCVKNAEYIISMLPAGKHVDALYLTKRIGLINYIKPSSLVIDSSTIDMKTSCKLASALSEKNISFVDAPVSGGVVGASAGTLSFMVGGSDTEFLHAKPILQSMGENIFHAGKHGAGQVAKVCNNMLLSVLMVGTSEAL